MNVLKFINEYITSPVLTSVMTVCGVFFAVKLKAYRPAGLIRAFKELRGGETVDGISPLSSLSVALAGTLGVGNIAGVAVAISIGGAGAVYWMMISAVTGAALKYCEAYLSVKLRGPSSFERGAPYYIEKISGRSAGCTYAVLCIVMSIISGPFIQMNAASSSVNVTYGVPKIITGVIFAVVCIVVAVGGIRRVSAFTSAAMPVFCAVFASVSLIAISMKINEVPGVICRIFTEAFGISQLTGGFSGALIASGIREGMTKGVFSHEAGCGTSSFSHAASSLTSPSAQGLIGVLEVLTDTLFFGGLTSLVILLSPAGKLSAGYDGAAISIAAYSYFFGAAARHMLTILTVFFAFATVLCWAYYGEKAISYLFRSDSHSKIYLFIYCASMTLGAVISASVIWQLSDIICAVMLALNCFCLIKGRRYIAVK